MRNAARLAVPILAIASLLPVPAAALLPLSDVSKIAAGYAHTCAVTTSGAVKCWGGNASGALSDDTGTERFVAVDVRGLPVLATTVTTGGGHTCALSAAGGVYCWGANNDGQVGDNSTADRYAPVPVVGLGSGVLAIAAGDAHTCALTTGGGVKCWGLNTSGQLGDNTGNDSPAPVDVTGLSSGVVAIAAGSNRSCAIASGGGMKCWGNGDYGAIGDGLTTNQLAPVDVSGLASGVAAMAVGTNHTCALTTGGGVKCWGANFHAQLGDGTFSDRPTPADVSGLASGMAAIASGNYHNCALTTGGGVKCWGLNQDGQLGAGGNESYLFPIDVPGLASGVTAIAAGGFHTCVLNGFGNVRCWGLNLLGQLGNGRSSQRALPASVAGIASGAASITAGRSHSCAVVGGGAKCWGFNNSGQLGDTSGIRRATPVGVSGLTSGVASIAAGDSHTCAVTSGGAASCWGENQSGQMGDGTASNSAVPVGVSGLASGVATIAPGYNHTCALTTAGGVKCWGRNAEGQAGDGTGLQQLAPVNVSGLTSGVAAIAVGFDHGCALTTGGGVKCWGYNLYGQLGDNTSTNRLVPVDVVGLSSGVTAIALGGHHSCALTTGGAVKCWGENGFGSLGNGTTNSSPVPVDVVGLASGASAIAAGQYHTCAIASGTLRCWGWNFYSQIGDGAMLDRLVPVDVAGLSGSVTAIAAGIGHTCVLLSGGVPKCWGWSADGQLGDGTLTATWSPSTVLAMPGPVKAVSSTQSHTLALDATGKVYAWGSDSHGQLGQGRAINRSSPAQVAGIPSMSHVSLSQHALAVDANGQVWAWGENSCGQLGPRAEAVTSKPARVVGAVGFTKVASGGCFSIALKSDGTVWGWGTIPGGPVSSDGSTFGPLGIANAVEIAAGATHALVRLGNGTVLALGDNSRGQTGQPPSGVVQGAMPVPGVSGATAIAAAGDSSMVLSSAGAIFFWGARADQSVVTPPLLVPFAPSVSISLAASTLYAVQTDGTTWKLTPPATVWQAVSGMSGMSRVQAGTGFVLAHAAGGQIYASGANNAGQFGQGDTLVRPGSHPVPGMTNVTMAAVGAVNPSVLALKPDGTLWFWGADTLGESGDGAAVGSSVPLLVNIPVKIVQVATGDRFSLALDSSGEVWAWGDNAAATRDPDLVNSSIPLRIPYSKNVQSIAAGGAGLALYLLADGTVARTGTIAAGTRAEGPTTILGLDNIVAIAAGTSAYALRGDNTLFAFGGNGSGELGNGSTTTSGTPVQVQGIAGTISSLSAGAARAAAVTSDGKVWSWGAGPLGNGTSGASSTAVQASGITDAYAASVGKAATLVHRSNGFLAAWGDTSLSDMPANPLAPYAVAFQGGLPFSVRAGSNNLLGFIVGDDGLGWSFGRYGSISNSSAAMGDGTYVARPRPVVMLAPGGAGNIDTNNWFLDLDPAKAKTPPAASTPKMLGIAQVSGSEGGLAFDATVKYKSADLGKSVSNYVFGLVPPAFFSAVKTALALSPKSRLDAKAAKNGGFVLAQLTPAGWSDVTGQLIAYSQGTANAAGGAANILNGVNAAALAGSRFCIGYGESSSSMLSFNALREVLLLPGASQNTSGVPCVLTGVYVDGPPGSRVGTAVTFKASVVGLNPAGQAQFTDSGAALSGPLGITASNDAVATAQTAANALAVGDHSIGALYLGDSQNAATSAEIPLRHIVTAALTQASLVGPASSDQYSQVVFEATVIGAIPTGMMQFKDGAVDLGSPVPLVGGQAVLRVSILALGDHNISAAYLGDGNNAATNSNVVAHKVVAVFTTRVTLTSSAIESVAGSSITLTATVTGVSPTGSVTFRDGTTVLGTVALTPNGASGVATLTISNLGAGGHQITASYSGDPNDDAVSSPAIVQQVATPAALSMSATSLAFGGQLRNTTSGSRTLTITNSGGAPLTVSAVSVAGPFTQTNNCATVAGGASCAIQVRFAPTALGALNGSVTIQSSLGPSLVTLTGTGAASLVSHYYTTILRRAPDAGGQAYWDAEAVRVSALGVNVNEVWFAMAQAFYFSAEYAALNRDNTGFITDLYTTFFNRAPDQAGLDFWVGQLAGGMPREVALASFMFSAEFRNFAQAIYGNTAARAEVDAVTDFYRGLLARLPDDGGFNFWVGRFRTAQCSGQAAILAEVEAISSAYALSAEYTARARTNVQYVGDLYNAFLRRGGDLTGVLFWINQVATAAQTREQVRVQFRNSAEFQARVAAIIAQGCL